jgi:hypothetical protein
MKKHLNIFILVFVTVFISQISFAKAGNDECLNCHLDLDDELLTPAKLYAGDVHYKMKITCAGCHGGDPTSDDNDIAMSEEKGFLGVPDKAVRYKVCINCHSDEQIMKRYGSKIPTNQFEMLKNSVHFQPSLNNNEPIADCVSCHSVHQIKNVNNPLSTVYPTNIVKLCGSCHSNSNYMRLYNPALPVDQEIKYRTSKHGKLNQQGNPDAAECASCHGSHNIFPAVDSRSNVYAINIPKVCSNCHSDPKLMSGYGIPTDQYKLFTESVHGAALIEKGDLSAPSCNDCHGNHGAVPPGVESISKVCGSCHVLNMELFEKSPHQKAFDENDFPECETCHGNHIIKHATDELVGVQKSSVCVECHSADDDNNGYKIASEMKSLIDSLNSEQKITIEILKDATQKGMDVSDAEFSLKDVRQILIQTRTSIHTFDIDKFKESITPGFESTVKIKQEGIDAVDDYYFRRVGLGIATIIVTFLVFGLYFKIKKMEKKL